jgi:hypothetical protein
MATDAPLAKNGPLESLGHTLELEDSQDLARTLRGCGQLL